MMHTVTTRLPYCESLELYAALRGGAPSCLFESASAVDKSSRMSMIGIDPVLELTGKDERLEVRVLQPRGQVYADFLQTEFWGSVEGVFSGGFDLLIPKTPFYGPEEERLNRPNIAQPLRRLLAEYSDPEKNFMGLYGALGYRFVYLFEDIEGAKPCHESDYHLFLFDNVLLFNHLTKDLSLYVTRGTTASAEEATADLNRTIGRARSEGAGVLSAILPPVFSPMVSVPDDATFQQQVGKGIQLCHEGELLEIVLSRKQTMRVSGDLLPLYASYRKINPSPYQFFFDFGNEILLGASPELMLRYEDGRATLRPISGSVRRSDNPIEDHRLMMELLNSPKENSELDMLIDLGRNDLARICKPGIEIDHYRIIEKYSHVTHTVSQVGGILEDGYTGFDALIASLNAGTLTGAPKVAAMHYIERIEQHSRGYYGGCIGWLLFDGDVNTAITIRTAHVRDGLLSFCAGATLLYESEPESELKETKIKSGAFLKAVAALGTA